MSVSQDINQASSNQIVNLLASETLTIGSLAKQCCVTVRTLRYYEEMDLIGPIRRSSGQYRLYSNRALKRIKAIQALQDLGYTLDQILVVLGPHSRMSQLSKAEQIGATEHSLQSIKRCIDEKLDMLIQMQKDVAHRLTIVESLCHPCLDHNPVEPCQEVCHHRQVHID